MDRDRSSDRNRGRRLKREGDSKQPLSKDTERSRDEATREEIDQVSRASRASTNIKKSKKSTADTPQKGKVCSLLFSHDFITRY